jgi:hypothetical protein
MKLIKSLILIALLGGFALQASASEKPRKPQSFILGDIIIKRPPVNDDGPGGPGR